ncbi:hypothetical protein [Microbacterium sp. Mcb102]|uniref:hypothetical protein n=1 Tax=Microbacterium sp. Mcb102 TaxID=2926012 RepID=UPI0021C6352A|nr:hypothetical protein [Microbacterium sp. Mcb102]
MTLTRHTDEQSKFLALLQDKLARQNRVLHIGHVNLALAAREASSLMHVVTATVFGFSLVAAISALAAAVGGAAVRSVSVLIIVGLVTATGFLFFGVLWFLSRHVQLAEAMLQITLAEQEDHRVLAALRGRARRSALGSLASFGPQWSKPSFE